MGVDRWRRLLPGLWLGLLLTVALVATPAAFALLGSTDAGRLVARVLAQEAHASLGFGAVLLALERVGAKRRADAGAGSRFSAGMVLAAGALFCTVAGYFAVQPMMEAARAGQGSLSFGQLHTISLGFFGVKVLLVAALAWRAAGR
jgi:cytochrome b561